jgi:hypothetical protein
LKCGAMNRRFGPGRACTGRHERRISLDRVRCPMTCLD